MIQTARLPCQNQSGSQDPPRTKFTRKILNRLKHTSCVKIPTCIQHIQEEAERKSLFGLRRNMGTTCHLLNLRCIQEKQRKLKLRKQQTKYISESKKGSLLVWRSARKSTQRKRKARERSGTKKKKRRAERIWIGSTRRTLHRRLLLFGPWPWNRLLPKGQLPSLLSPTQSQSTRSTCDITTSLTTTIHIISMNHILTFNQKASFQLQAWPSLSSSTLVFSFKLLFTL